MLPQNWQNVQIEKPKGYKSLAVKIPLSALYDSGYFVSAIFGSEAWVINKKTFESQPMHILSSAPSRLSKGMQSYANKQYRRFLAKQQRLISHLSEHRSRFE